MNRKPDFCLGFAPFVFLLAVEAHREGEFDAK